MNHTEGISKVVSGEANSEEKQSALSNLDKENDSKQEYHHLKNVWALLASEKEMSSYKLETLYLNFQTTLHSRKRTFTFNSSLKYAAVFIAAAGISCLYFYNQHERKSEQTTAVFNTAVVAENGQRSKIILPDSSVVWLNSGTQLTYNSDYAHTNRDITLAGQAFFQVTKNKNLPFTVNCNKLMVKVLGTRFDVDAYPDDENISVALQTGSVELLPSIFSRSEPFQYQLIPGEVAQFNIYSEKVVINKVNLDRMIEWKDGILSFADSPMKEVLLKLERKYNIDIEVKNPKIYKSVFTATIKNETLEEIFKSIDYSCSVDCKIIRGVDRNKKTKVIIR